VEPDRVTQTANSLSPSDERAALHKEITGPFPSKLYSWRSTNNIATAATGAGIGLEGFLSSRERQKPRMFEMTKKTKHKSKESKEERKRDKDDRMTPRDDDRDRTVPDDQKREE
jgi:hypothetical protein